MVLVDTSIRVDHLRHTNSDLTALLEQNRVAMHSMVIGELACAHLRNREEVLHLWQRLESLPTANHKEAVYFIEQASLMGRGIGYVDAHLLASLAPADGSKLWTKDKRLMQVAAELNCARTSPMQAE